MAEQDEEISIAAVDDAWLSSLMLVFETWRRAARQTGASEEEIQNTERDFHLYVQMDRKLFAERPDTYTHDDVVALLEPSNLWIPISKQVGELLKEMPRNRASTPEDWKKRVQVIRSDQHKM